MHGHPLVAIIEFGQQFGMPFDHAAHVAQRGVDALVTAGERVLDVGEQPWTALAAAADRNTRATGFGDHRQRVVGTPNIPVAEDGNIKLGNQLADAGPIGMPTVIFGGGARVQGDGLAAFLLRDVSGFEEGLMVMVDADADFGRDWYVGRVAHLDHTLDDLTEQVRLPWQRGTATTTRHLGHRAAEVEVDMVGHVLVDDDFRGLLHNRGIDAVQLQRANLLAGCETA